MKKKLFSSIKFGLGLLILLILLYKVGFREVIDVLSSMGTLYLIPVVIVFFLSFFLGALNLKLLAYALGLPIATSKLFFANVFSWSLSLIIPGRIGEFSLIYFLAKEKINLGQSSAIALIDRLITFIVVAVFAVIGFFMFFTAIDALKLLAIMIVGFVGVIFLLFTPLGRAFIRDFILRKYSKPFKGFSKSLFFLLNKKTGYVLFNLLLTMLKAFIMSLMVWLLFASFDKPVPFLPILIISAVGSIVSLIPITVSGLGVRESAAVILYSRIGVDPAITLAVYVIVTVVNYAFGSLFLGLGLKTNEMIAVRKRVQQNFSH